MTVDDILIDIERAGYVVRSILQNKVGRWWCCLSNREDTATDGGEGKTIHEALKNTLAAIKKSRPVKPETPADTSFFD